MIERLRVRIPAEAAGEFSSPELALCDDSYSVSVLPHWHVKDPGHSVKSAGGRLHLNKTVVFNNVVNLDVEKGRKWDASSSCLTVNKTRSAICKTAWSICNNNQEKLPWES